MLLHGLKMGAYEGSPVITGGYWGWVGKKVASESIDDSMVTTESLCYVT